MSHLEGATRRGTCLLKPRAKPLSMKTTRQTPYPLKPRAKPLSILPRAKPLPARPPAPRLEPRRQLLRHAHLLVGVELERRQGAPPTLRAGVSPRRGAQELLVLLVRRRAEEGGVVRRRCAQELLLLIFLLLVVVQFSRRLRRLLVLILLLLVVVQVSRRLRLRPRLRDFVRRGALLEHERVSGARMPPSFKAGWRH
ncbi:hypothetical protein T484DRAFT_2124933 [Baffinella frigidus]|nr:hypothetical protein T484DRAFT_2124933 [Cryptophyta sp. CCMP2293]